MTLTQEDVDNLSLERAMEHIQQLLVAEDQSPRIIGHLTAAADAISATYQELCVLAAAPPDDDAVTRVLEAWGRWSRAERLLDWVDDDEYEVIKELISAVSALRAREGQG